MYTKFNLKYEIQNFQFEFILQNVKYFKAANLLSYEDIRPSRRIIVDILAQAVIIRTVRLE